MGRKAHLAFNSVNDSSLQEEQDHDRPTGEEWTEGDCTFARRRTFFEKHDARDEP